MHFVATWFHPLFSRMCSIIQFLVLAAMLGLFHTTRAIFLPNITYYLSEFPPFLGADIATSIPLSLSNGSLSLWLFGDTITGMFSAGQRTITNMPRNSVGLFHTIQGVPQSSLSHFIRYATVPADVKHVGFWSPPEDSHWYWPTTGLVLNGQVFVFAMNMMDFGGGLFPFALSSIDVIRVSASPLMDPLKWISLILGQLPLPNNHTSLANAVAVEGDVVYLMGSFGPTGQAFITRISVVDLELGAFEKIELWSTSHTWVPFSDFNVSNVLVLFDFMPSETTLQYHTHLQAWFVIIVNSFIYGSTIMIRLAATLNGTWSSPIPLFTIPSQFLQKSDFCYAGKAHPELQTSHDEIVFTFNCNTPTLDGLIDRDYMYIPQVVRVNASLVRESISERQAKANLL